MEAVSGADRQSVKDALGNLDGGEQYSQAKMQQQQTQREVLQLKRQVQDNAEVWQTLLAKELGEVDWSTRCIKAWITKLDRM